jgi:hypothetical protein
MTNVNASAFWSEVFFKSLANFATGWSIVDCPLNSNTLLQMAEGSHWLKVAKAKNSEFIKNSENLNIIAPSYILDVVYGVDFILEIEFANGPFYYSVDVTSNKSLRNIEHKVATSKRDCRADLAQKLDLYGHMIIGIDEKFSNFSLLSHWEKVGIVSTIEKAFINEMPYVRLKRY